jgi:hypothetical protein
MTENTPAAQSEKSKTERAVFWIGSICGILISLFTIYDRVVKPTPPDLRITFFESASQSLALFPPTDTSIAKTKPIPVQIKIENLGGTVAKNVKLYLSYDSMNSITAEYKKEEKRTWNSPNEVMNQLSISMEDINPAESFLVPLTLELEFPRNLQIAIRSPPGTVSDKSLLEPRGYPIYVDVSSDTSPNRRTELLVLLGSVEALQQHSQDIYWVGYGPEGPRVLKAKEDFLNPAPPAPPQ